ncbi:MAG: sugar transferase [Pseudomonadota bacterium]
MKIVLTGASGFVGREVVPLLAKAGADLCLVGRTPETLRQLFPHHQSIGYDEVSKIGTGADMLVHLAVRNNNVPGTPEDFTRDNADLAISTLSLARTAGISRFVAVSSVQVMTGKQDDSYVQSKRLMEKRLADESGIDISVLHLPLVYGSGFAGRLSFLSRLPPFLQKPLFNCVAALKPTVAAQKLADHILEGAASGIVSDGQARNPVFRLIKRLIDLFFVAVVIGFFWWLLILLWLAVRLTSSGPGIFTQIRLGRSKIPFTLLKFRSMAQGTKQAGTHEVSAASVTRIGGFMRATKLDELPQVWNILTGQLSLIGPRPGLPNQSELMLCRERHGVFAARPGITGLAQIEGIDMSVPERLAQKDAEYLALQGLILELKIALATFTGKGGGDNVDTR